jgi:hypothetical protein
MELGSSYVLLGDWGGNRRVDNIAEGITVVVGDPLKEFELALKKKRVFSPQCLDWFHLERRLSVGLGRSAHDVAHCSSISERDINFAANTCACFESRRE